MAELKTTIAGVGEYDGYLIEVRYPDHLSDEITETLDENFSEMGATIGEENVYVRFLNESADRELLDKLDRNIDLDTMPWLILLDRHPDSVESGDECLIIELGRANSKREATIALRKAREALNDERFMRRMSREQQFDRLRHMFSSIEPGVQLVVSLASFLV